jgi:hypothetical protein
MCGNPFSMFDTPKVSTPAVVDTSAADAETAKKARASSKRAQEKGIWLLNQNVSTSGTGVSGSANTAKTTLG